MSYDQPTQSLWQVLLSVSPIFTCCSLYFVFSMFAGSKTGMWNTHTKPLFSRGHNKRLPGHRRSCHTGLVSLTNSKLMMTSLWWRGIEYSCFLSGFDLENDKATIGLVLPVWSDTLIRFDGDGLVQCYNSGFSLLYKLLKARTDICSGFVVSSNGSEHIFKPVSVQAMWYIDLFFSLLRDDRLMLNIFFNIHILCM